MLTPISPHRSCLTLVGDALARHSSLTNSELAESRSTRGTLFTGASHNENQAYNVQADLHTLLDTHFTSLRKSTMAILDEQVSCRHLSAPRAGPTPPAPLPRCDLAPLLASP